MQDPAQPDVTEEDAIEDVVFDELPIDFQEFVLGILNQKRNELLQRKLVVKTSQENRMQAIASVMNRFGPVMEAVYGPDGSVVFAEAAASVAGTQRKQESGHGLMIRAIDLAINKLVYLKYGARGEAPPEES